MHKNLQLSVFHVRQCKMWLFLWEKSFASHKIATQLFCDLLLIFFKILWILNWRRKLAVYGLFFRSGIFSLMYEMTVSLLNHDIIMRWTPYGFFIGSARISVTTFMRWLKNGLAISKLKCEENNPICIIKGLLLSSGAAAKCTFGSSSSARCRNA